MIDYMSAISALSDKYGNYLIELMEQYKKDRLPDISESEARNFYHTLIKRLNLGDSAIKKLESRFTNGGEKK